MKGNLIGAVAFFVGLLLAAFIALIGAGTSQSLYVFLLAALGVVVGLLNVQDKEVVPFLIATIAFMLSFEALSNIVTTLALGWGFVSMFFDLLKVFIAPAAAVVALKAIVNVARN